MATVIINETPDVSVQVSPQSEIGLTIQDDQDISLAVSSLGDLTLSVNEIADVSLNLEVGQGPAGARGTTEVSFSIPGVLSPSPSSTSMRWYFTETRVITNVVATVGTAPVGAAIVFDVNKNGTSIFTTQANRPIIAPSTFTDLSSVPNVTSFVSGDYVTVDIDQVGTVVAGADAVIRLVLG